MRQLAAVFLLSLSSLALADNAGKVQPDPTSACSAKSFKPHELCFDTPKDEIARAEYLSESFYAIILKTAEPCSISETERLETQRAFPGAKVFSMRFQCDDGIDENISYTNVNDKFGFLAVYAGRTMKDAKATLEAVKATGKFQDANIRKMQAKLVYP